MMNDNNPRLKSAGRRLPVLLALCTLLMTAVIFLPALAQDTPDATAGDPSPDSVGAAASDPDFSTVDDPLSLKYELFPADDLLVSRPMPLDNATKTQVNNYILKTADKTITSQSILTADTPGCWLMNGRQPQQTRVGRFFNLGYDVIVTLLPNGKYASGSDCSAPEGEPNMSLHIQTTQGSVNNPTPFTLSPVKTALAMDDFNQDGFDDLFIMSETEVLVASADDLLNLNAGMRFGPAKTLPTTDYATDFDPTSGDFNNDGLVDVAWIGNDRTVHFATVCPGSVAGTICSEAEEFEVLLDPLESQTKPILYPVESVCLDRSAVTAGLFDPKSYNGHGLVQFVCIQTGTNQLNYLSNITAKWYQFEDDWSMVGGAPIAEQVLTTMVDSVTDDLLPGAPQALFAQAGKLYWFGESEQVAWSADYVKEINSDGWIDHLFLGTLTFDGTTITNQMIQAETPTGGYFPFEEPFEEHLIPWLNGLAIGFFGTINDPTDETAYTQQIAVLLNEVYDDTGGFSSVWIFSIDSDFKPVSPKYTTLSPAPNRKDNLSDPQQTNWLVSGDLQGRSGRLGSPSIVRVSSHSQPSVILGAPPMHVDYILPDASTASEWQVVNFTAVPGTYNSSYRMSTTTQNQSSDTNTTSYTYASSEAKGNSLSLKIPYLPAISGAIKKSTEDKHEEVSETYTFTQNEFAYNASTTTGFGDEIWYSQSSFNVYYYPVLGETVCPADNSDCSAGEEQPLYVAISGPDSTAITAAPGANTEWYQPVHEPGNIFSYPWNSTLLAERFEQGIDTKSKGGSFFTDDSTTGVNIDWSFNSGQDSTTGTTNTHSFEKSYSISTGKPFGEISDVNPDGIGDFEGNVDYNSSTSIGTLNKSSSSIGESQGITISKPGTFLNYDQYQYHVEPYIIGRAAPEGYVDTVKLQTDIQTVGPLQAAFAADPLDPEAGSWWGSNVSPYTKAIDVALNHPARWTQSDPTGTQESLNCLEASGDRYNCMTFNDPAPNDLWNSEFYWMRGLLVTVGGEDGPQRQQANAGEAVFLEARVYNYSFKDMDAGSSIKVRFYRQEMNGTTPVGDSVLIAEQTMQPLPGFKSPNSPDTANWNSITALLDTTDLGDTYQMFWVVVWAEDSSGEMLTELQGHGLGEKPDTLTSITDVVLEKVTVEDQKTYSNNVGFLHSKFYIADETTASPLPDDDPQLEIVGAAVKPASAQPGERVIVSAHVAAEEAPADSVHVQLYPDAAAWYAYQDDPTLTPPRAFDVEILPFIDVGTADRLEVPYRSSTCGKQTILIVAKSGVQGDQTTATASLDNGPCLAYFPVMPVQAP